MVLVHRLPVLRRHYAHKLGGIECVFEEFYPNQSNGPFCDAN